MLSPEGFGLLPITSTDPALLAGFDCGKPHLNEFLADDAPLLHKGRFGFTSLVFHKDVQGLVGYFTLSNDAIHLNTSEQDELGVEVPLNSFPAVKLGRLAVSKALQGMGTGTQVLSLVLGEIVSEEALSAARLLVVDAEHEQRVIQFYERGGFQRSLWADKRAQHHQKKRTLTPVKMWMDILAAKPL